MSLLDAIAALRPAVQAVRYPCCATISKRHPRPSAARVGSDVLDAVSSATRVNGYSYQKCVMQPDSCDRSVIRYRHMKMTGNAVRCWAPELWRQCDLKTHACVGTQWYRRPDRLRVLSGIVNGTLTCRTLQARAEQRHC